MSLETSLELNNKLLTQHNALLEQLITALASGQTIKPETVATQVQEYREAAPDKSVSKAGEPDLEKLEFSDIIALAGFYPDSVELSAIMLQRAIDYRDAVGEKRVLQIDALDGALRGVKRAQALHKNVLLQLSRDTLSFWDELPTIADRHAFAEAWLDAKPDDRDAVKPKKTGNKNKQQERKGPFYVGNADGDISEVSTETELKSCIEAGYKEIHKVEYLQLKEKSAETANANADGAPDYSALRKTAEGLILQLAKGGYRNEAVAILSDFGAQKLGSVADEDLTALIGKAEKVLED